LSTAHVEDFGIQKERVHFTLGVLGRHQVARAKTIELLLLILKSALGPILLTSYACMPLLKVIDVELLGDLWIGRVQASIMNGLTSDVGSKELLQVLCLDGGHALLDLVVILLSWAASFLLAILLLAMAIYLRLSSQIVFVLLL